MDFEIISPSSVHPTSDRGYSHAARMGNLLFVSGQVARDQAGQTVGKGDIKRQTEQVFDNLRAVLEASGSGLEWVGKITVFTTDLTYRPAIGEVRDRVFRPVGHFPASTFVVISSLADPDFLVEIEAVALIREQEERRVPVGE